jgi:hypothetical protein
MFSGEGEPILFKKHVSPVLKSKPSLADLREHAPDFSS